MVKAPRLDSDGIGLLSSFLLFEAKKRLPAREALRHPYFSSFPSEIRMLKDSKFYSIFLSHHQVVFPLSKQRTNVSPRLDNLASREQLLELRFSLG